MDDDDLDLDLVEGVAEGLSAIFTTKWGWCCILLIAIVIGCFWYMS